MKGLIGYNVFEGDPDLIAEGQIPVIGDSGAVDGIADVRQGINGNMVSLVTDKVTFAITPAPTDASVSINGVAGTGIKTYKGAAVNWTVYKTGYKTQGGAEAVATDTAKAITLEANS